MGLLDQLNEVLLQTPRKYWGDKATRLGSLLGDAASTGAQAYGSANSPMAPEHANTLAGLLADFTPVVGDVKSAYDGMNAAREGDYLGAALGGLGALPLVPNLAGITAWHGSKHLFPPTVKSKLGEFDLSKVRTGDGTNLQGVGTYLADVQDVGKRYAGSNGYLYKVDLPDEVIPRMFNLDEPILSQSHLRTELNSIHEKNPDLKERIFDAAKQGKNGQYMYDTIMEKFARDLKAKGMTGEDVYHQANEMTSKVFKESGIPGVRYLDRASRESGKGTSNYVVYDPAILKILDRSSN